MSRRDPASFYERLFDLQGKVAVVIGGTGVLCGEMARGLLNTGVKVVLVGRNADKAEEHFQRWGTTPDEARFFQADVAKRENIARIVPEVMSWYDRIDIWINGATIAPPATYLEITDQQFEETLAVNVKAVYMACQIIGRHWIDHKSKGCIINMSSMAAIRPLSRTFIYSLAKAAVVNLTQNLAREWAEWGIRVNALCPGFFPSEQNRKILDKQRVKAIMRHTPIHRFGEPGELIGATLLLASDAAGSFITGSNLIVDGGFSAMAI